MNNFLVLYIGELQRMKKYNIIAASIISVLVMIGILHFIGSDNLTEIFPLFVFLDATAMAMLMIGVTMFFEKQEGVLKSLLISPINKVEYLLSKTFANTTTNIISLLILYGYAKIFKTVDVNIITLILFVILIAIFHSFIGFILTFYSKDFTEMLIGMMKLSFIFILPVVLDTLKVFDIDIVSKILYIIPTKSSMILLYSTIGKAETWEWIFSIIYLLLISFLVYLFISKKFDDFAVKESGV